MERDPLELFEKISTSNVGWRKSRVVALWECPLTTGETAYLYRLTAAAESPSKAMEFLRGRAEEIMNHVSSNEVCRRMGPFRFFKGEHWLSQTPNGLVLECEGLAAVPICKLNQNT